MVPPATQSHTDRARNIREDHFLESSLSLDIDEIDRRKTACPAPDPHTQVRAAQICLTAFEHRSAAALGMPREYQLSTVAPLLLGDRQARSFDPSPAFAAGTSD